MSMRGLALMAALVVGGCSAAPTTQYACTPACPTGSHCTVSGCVVDGAAADMPPPDMAAAVNGCQPACGGSTPVCNPQGTCVACAVDGDCPTGQVCALLGGTAAACVAGCKDDGRCRGDGGSAARSCCSGACANTDSDPGNCGQCGKSCQTNHGAAACVAGSCVAGACADGWGDCNADTTDGCETNLKADPQSCGACGTACALPHATAGCSGTCYVKACDFGWDDCDATASNGCETGVRDDAKNCGACGNSCPRPPHATTACVQANCALTQCEVGYLDCDGSPADGCEVAVLADVKNCGACGNTCAQGLVCRSGTCTCPQCNYPNATSKCINMVCALTGCVAGWGNCNGVDKDGCEKDVTADPINCGACGTVCPPDSPYCDKGVCTMFSLFPSDHYDAAVTFKDALGGTTMGLTYDGTGYWSVSGGGPMGNRLASYDGDGNFVLAYQPGIDFRSIFTLGGNDPTVYARGFNSGEVQVMNNPGMFMNSLALKGGAPDAQAQVVLDDTGNELISMNSGTVARWDSGTGAFIANVTLIGYGKGGENMYPQNRGIAKVHGYYLTYYNQILSAWDDMGNLAKTTTLNGAGTSFDSYFGYSWANGMFFVVDMAGATWRGYDVGL